MPLMVPFGGVLPPKLSGLPPVDLEPQTISEALLEAFGTLGSTFGPSQTVSEPLGDRWAVFNPKKTGPPVDVEPQTM